MKFVITNEEEYIDHVNRLLDKGYGFIGMNGYKNIFCRTNENGDSVIVLDCTKFLKGKEKENDKK